jgi:hypothetical protein
MVDVGERERETYSCREGERVMEEGGRERVRDITYR